MDTIDNSLNQMCTQDLHKMFVWKNWENSIIQDVLETFFPAHVNPILFIYCWTDVKQIPSKGEQDAK